MNTRLQQFLAAENISQSQFADSIGVAKASVSHILAGRNKPGFDFIEGMSRRFPTLNLEWLITGKGKMYKGSAADIKETPSAQVRPQISNSLFDDNTMENNIEEDSILSNTIGMPELNPTAVIHDSKSNQPESNAELIKSIALGKLNEKSTRKHSISKIIVLYDDNSYIELT